MSALLADPVSKEHDAGAGHPEWPERFDAALRGLQKLKLTPVPPRAGTEDEVERETLHERALWLAELCTRRLALEPAAARGSVGQP